MAFSSLGGTQNCKAACACPRAYQIMLCAWHTPTLTHPRSMLRCCPAYVCELAALTKEIRMQIVGWMILLLLIVARPALAAFEGYIEMTMTLKEGSGTMKGQISSVGARTEVAARVAQMGHTPVTMPMHLTLSNRAGA